MARSKKIADTPTSTAPKRRSIDLQEVEARVEALDKAKRRSYDIFDIEQRVYDLEANSGGGDANLTTLSVTPSTSSQTITPEAPYDGFNEVDVAAVTAAIDANITAGNIKKDVSILGVTGTYEGSGGDIDFFSVFDGKTYVTTGISIYSNRVEILDGGYCVDNGICYVKIKLKAKVEMAATSPYDVIYTFPNTTLKQDFPFVLIKDGDSISDANDLFNAMAHGLFRYQTNPVRLTLQDVSNNDIFWVYAIYPTT